MLRVPSFCCSNPRTITRRRWPRCLRFSAIRTSRISICSSRLKPLQPPAPDVEPLIPQALQQRPEVQSLQFQVESAQKNDAAEHDLWRPTVSALGVVGIAPVRDPAIPNWYGAVGVNVNIPVFNGFLYNARAKTADLQTEVARQKLSDARNNIARDVRTAGRTRITPSNVSRSRSSFGEQANLALDLAQPRYNLGLGSIVEFTQAELGKTEADIADTDAQYQYRLTQIVLAYTIAAAEVRPDFAAITRRSY